MNVILNTLWGLAVTYIVLFSVSLAFMTWHNLSAAPAEQLEIKDGWPYWTLFASIIYLVAYNS